MIYVAWPEAKGLCEEQGKRLCTEDEWTFACEGEEATPYPYGYDRDPTACAIDSKWRAFNERAMQPRDGYEAKAEMDRLWQGHASGAMPRCKSVFGVFDMTGNVDEWTKSSRPGERPSILKGGYWGSGSHPLPPLDPLARREPRLLPAELPLLRGTCPTGAAATAAPRPLPSTPLPTTPPGGLMPPFDVGALDVPPIESWNPPAPADAPEGGG
jgi:hypothetical protein